MLTGRQEIQIRIRRSGPACDNYVGLFEMLAAPVWIIGENKKCGSRPSFSHYRDSATEIFRLAQAVKFIGGSLEIVAASDVDADGIAFQNSSLERSSAGLMNDFVAKQGNDFWFNCLEVFRRLEGRQCYSA